MVMFDKEFCWCRLLHAAEPASITIIEKYFADTSALESAIPETEKATACCECSAKCRTQ